jgi:hypothetical protein
MYEDIEENHEKHRDNLDIALPSSQKPLENKSENYYYFTDLHGE